MRSIVFIHSTSRLINFFLDFSKKVFYFVRHIVNDSFNILIVDIRNKTILPDRLN